MVEVTQDGWTDASTPAPHGEQVLAEFREWNSPNGAIKQQVVWWWEGEWRTYTNTEDKAYCDRWRPLPRIASLQAENTHWCSVANQRALDLASERQRVRVLEEALRGYLDGCDNDECEACENARKALGEG